LENWNIHANGYMRVLFPCFLLDWLHFPYYMNE